MCNWQAVVFDMDDTLFPEREYVMSGFRAVALWAERCLGIAACEGVAQFVRMHAEGVRGNTFNLWLAMHGQPETLVPTLVEVYRAHTPHIQPYDGVRRLLATLKHQHRAAVGLVSDGFLQVQQRKYVALGLGRYFDAVVFSDMFGRSGWKPSTRPFIAIAARLGVDPTRTVYIGDNPLKDFIGARRVGMQTIWLRHPDGEYIHRMPPTTEHAADRTVSSIAALSDLVLGGWYIDHSRASEYPVHTTGA